MQHDNSADDQQDVSPRVATSRRRFLTVTGSATLATALAGCQFDEDSETDTATEGSTGVNTATDTASESETETDTGPSFIGTEGTAFTLGDGQFTPLGGNHPQLRKQSSEEQERWFDEWLEVVPDLNVLRATAWGNGTENTDVPLQPEPGEHNEEGLRRLDRLVAACAEHDVRLILPLTNYWDWQGGIPQYVAWSDNAETKSDFYTDEQCQQWYRNHIETILNRENSITSVTYKNDPTIMLWELANEPEGREAFRQWVADTADYIKSIDDNHLVSTGMGMATRATEFAAAHDAESIDAYSLHVWADPQHTGIGPDGGVEVMQAHKEAADDLDIPLYVGEFGWSVDRTDNTPDYRELNRRNRIFEGWFLAMRELDVAGSLVWDLRYDSEYPLGWNHYGVFPQDPYTPEIVADAYGSFETSPSDAPGLSGSGPSMSVSLGEATGTKQLRVPNTGGGVDEEATVTLRPTGHTFTDPGDASTSGRADLSATAAFGYDADALYVRIEVTDDRHLAQAGSSMWKQDSVQFAAASDGTYGPEYGVSHADGNSSIVRWMSGSATAPASAVDAETCREGSTTVYNLTIPWNAMFAEAPAPGDTVPFSFIVNDNDGDDESRDGVLGWTLPGVNGEKAANALGLLVLEDEGSVPWTASAQGGPGLLDASASGTWRFEITNYAADDQSFEVGAGETSETVDVPSGQTATIEINQAFGTQGTHTVGLDVTNTATGGSSTLSETVVVIDTETPLIEAPETTSTPTPTGRESVDDPELLSDPYADTSLLNDGSDLDNLVVNNYRPEVHPLPDGSPDDTRLKRGSSDPASLIYTMDEPVAAMELIWSQEKWNPGTVTVYESTDGGSSWGEVTTSTEQFATAGPDEYPEKWRQKRTTASFSEGVTAVRYDIDGGKAWSPQPCELTLHGHEE